MYEYTIKDSADRKTFNEFCTWLMTDIKAIERTQFIDDFDRAQIQLFKTPNGTIKVYNDYEVDAVYVDAEIKLDNIVKHFAN
jgi:hypothetical protein